MSFFSSFHHVHLVGIKGVAMTALAQCLNDIGTIKITGSDVAEDFVTKDVLDKFGFQVLTDFDPAHISGDVDLVIYTGAHQGKQNIEVQTAIKLGIPALSHAEALGKIMDGKRGISVCGTGGKSTTSAMIAWILEYAGKKPSYAIGVGNVPNLARTGRYVADTEWFVAEADEYAVDPTDDHRPRFIFQHPEVIVCTHVSYDHPDIYPDFATMQKTFADFFKTLPENGVLINEETAPAQFAPFDLQLPGAHNQKNAWYATLAVKQCGVSEEISRQALTQFTSTMRRFEYKGKINGVDCYDDYAHTPDEIRSTLQALREWRPGKRIVVAFQPHTYSRTKALFDGFVQELGKADVLILLDIFASAREAVDPAVSSKLLGSKIANTKYQIASYADLARLLPEVLQPDDIFITMGAGDIYKVYESKLH